MFKLFSIRFRIIRGRLILFTAIPRGHGMTKSPIPFSSLLKYSCPAKSFIGKKKNSLVPTLLKLDGVGSVDNRPSTN